MNRIVLVVLVGQMLALSGCYGTALCLRGSLADYKRSEEVQVAFEPRSKLVVHNEAGAIRVTAQDRTDCRIAAKIYVHTPTKQEAREIGEQVQIVAEPNEGTVRVSVQKPPMSQENRFVSVDFDILVPRQAGVECRTEFGKICLIGLEGDVKAATQFGSVICENAQGSLDLSTEFGRVKGRKIVADRVAARTQFGSVDIVCDKACPREMTADVKTEWGKVRFKAPPDYQGAIDLGSESSTVRSAMPVAAQGEVSRHKISGTVGEGQGNLRLSTERGSIRLR